MRPRKSSRALTRRTLKRLQPQLWKAAKAQALVAQVMERILRIRKMTGRLPREVLKRKMPAVRPPKNRKAAPRVPAARRPANRKLRMSVMGGMTPNQAPANGLAGVFMSSTATASPTR